MNVVERAGGLDVHKRTVVACLLTPGAHGTPHQELRTFSTVTADLLWLAAWLHDADCTHVAMASTCHTDDLRYYCDIAPVSVEGCGATYAWRAAPHMARAST
jgi:hypothetical protein